MNRDYYIECLTKYKGRLERKQKELAGLKKKIILSLDNNEPFFVIEPISKKCKQIEKDITDINFDIAWAEGHLSK